MPTALCSICVYCGVAFYFCRARKLERAVTYLLGWRETALGNGEIFSTIPESVLRVGKFFQPAVHGEDIDHTCHWITISGFQVEDIRSCILGPTFLVFSTWQGKASPLGSPCVSKMNASVLLISLLTSYALYLAPSPT